MLKVEEEKKIGTAERVNVDKKRLINCRTVDVNQLMPLKYNWAWEHY
nr:Ribonucleoside-diphosphate reductase subunit beta [Chlamydiota bacterium]